MQQPWATWPHIAVVVVFDKKKKKYFLLGRSLAGWGKSSRMFHLEPIKYNVYTFKTRLSQSSAGVPGILLVFKYSRKKPVSLRTGLPRALSEPQSLCGRFEIALLLIFKETFEADV